jgi:hypothetical protein
MRESDCDVRLASRFGANILGDIWAAILVGTICRRQYAGLKIITAGQRQWHSDAPFANSLAGLTALQLSDRVITDGTNRHVDIDESQYVISHQRRGILEAGAGKTRTLLEFDPQDSIATRIQGKTPKARLFLFGDLILEFRRELELGYLYHDRPVWGSGNAPASLTRFLIELHENAYKYSRSTAYDNRSLRGLRIVRMKAHLATSKEELLRRVSSDSLMSAFLDQSVSGKGTHGIMEAIVSDFGLGIVDHFLSSQRGAHYREYDRRSLLHNLIHDRLSSTNDPGAGFGISRALKAARSMRGYVSVRTGEFWLAQSFSDSATMDKDPVLQDVGGVHPPIAGTHWQFLWPMGM